MDVELFDYNLPEELIAQEPVEPRDHCRLMVLERNSGRIEHRIFKEIVDYLQEGDALVLNDTKVIPARLFGQKTTGAGVELLLLHETRADVWEALVRPGNKIKPGNTLIFGAGSEQEAPLKARVIDRTDFGGRIVSLEYEGELDKILHRLGEMPLPPYIHRELDDPDQYQTVYARERGSAAAPTAGLHFTPELLQEIKEMGVRLVYITLHVGLGTFRPVNTRRVEEHKMHSEFYRVTPEAAELINRTRRKGGRIIAVGTTVIRTLETVGDDTGKVRAGEGWTDIFIYPGYRFKVIDGMVTNFHLPKSTLIMMVSSFAGREKIMEAYQEAMNLGYRFFSFGDAMLII